MSPTISATECAECAECAKCTESSVGEARLRGGESCSESEVVDKPVEAVPEPGDDPGKLDGPRPSDGARFPLGASYCVGAC